MEYLTFDTVIIGSGAAGFNGACEIKKRCNKSVCIVTEGKANGTSRNTGSDKQTYYKLSLSGEFPDSVRKMAEDLFSGGAVDGDNALCEAALSPQCFYNLCSLGVPFPHNRYGEYTGYKTDHDPYMRATSAGPLTSKFMTEALEKQAENLDIPVFDKLLAIDIITAENKVCGLLCFNKSTFGFTGIYCNNIILATGGPAGIYENTVYPEGHTGASSLAIKAGAGFQNLTEWQYGLSSVSPKWNVSGTYMQVLPCFISVDENGNEYEFLTDYFEDIYKALSLVFLKGYQWPFDSKKAENGSSLIDLAVYNESIIKQRRVYLDYRKNPFGLKEIDFSKLCKECFTYLENAHALLGTPIERLRKMNAPAIELYMSKGRDLTKEMLPIDLCAQHNNGGIAVDMWWQTEITGLFAVGECAGTHGVARPGGSALNAGQAGSLRAAQYISQKEDSLEITEDIKNSFEEKRKKNENMLTALISPDSNIEALQKESRRRMSSVAGAVRKIKEMRKLYEDVTSSLLTFPESIRIKDISQAELLYKYEDTLLMQSAVLKAMLDYYDTVRHTRGSAVYEDENGNIDLSPDFTFTSKIQMLYPRDNGFSILWRDVRPVPTEDEIFENIWKSYRENKNIY